MFGVEGGVAVSRTVSPPPPTTTVDINFWGVTQALDLHGFNLVLLNAIQRLSELVLEA